MWKKGLPPPCGSAGKESACNAGDPGWIPGLGRFPGEGKGYPLQDSGLENSMDCKPWGCEELDMTEQLSLNRSIQKNMDTRYIKSYCIFSDGFCIHLKRNDYT